jgi:leader peptidase (prepilin peptidase)/N-methyltransferase
VSDENLEPRPAVIIGGAAAIISFSFITLSGWTALACAVLGTLMVIGVETDARTFKLPNVLTAGTFLAGLLFASLLEPRDAAFALAMAITRAVVTAAVLVLIRWGYAQLRHREGLGLGDVKLAAGIGAWLPADLIPACFALAAACALLMILWKHWRGAPMDAAAKIPFGAFLCPALWLMFYVNVLSTEKSSIALFHFSLVSTRD